MAAPTLDGFDAALRGGATAGGAPLGHPPTPLRIVWPTNDNIRASLAGWESGGSVPSMAKYTRAPGLARRLCVWGGEPVGRARAIAHMKSLARVADDGRVAWAVLGSHNFSCAAWGSMAKPTKKAAVEAALGLGAPPPPLPASVYIRSFEVSVALTPGREAAYRAHRHRGFCVLRPPPGSTLADAGAGGCPPPAPAPPIVHFWAGHRAPGRVTGTAAGGEGAAPPEVVGLPLPYNCPPVRYGEGDIAWASDSPPLGVPDVYGRVFGS
jgi:tyrosyl-DNA phosphodiesterase-1